jgi:hypothetical protein
MINKTYNIVKPYIHICQLVLVVKHAGLLQSILYIAINEPLIKYIFKLIFCRVYSQNIFKTFNTLNKRLFILTQGRIRGGI